MFGSGKCLWCLWVLSLAITGGGCTGKNGSGPGDILVSTDWLQDHLNEPDLVILHAGSAEGYDTIHIPGARLVLPSDFVVSADSLRNEMPTVDSIAGVLRRVGVNKDSKLVLYYESTRLLTRTARIFVALDRIGMGRQTFLLNGGLPAWEEEERETTTVAPDFSPGELEAPDPREVIIKAAELDRQRWNPGLVVIDARNDEEYYGTPSSEEGPAEGGHIEGANSLPYQALLYDDKPYLFRSDTELKKLFRGAEMDPGKVTAVYCGSGIRASVSYLAASHLGYPVVLYDGSYEEWEALELPLTGPVTVPGNND